MRYEFKLTGKTALLMHMDDVMLADEVSAWRLAAENAKKKGENSGDDRRPAWTWLTYCYHDGRRLAVPQTNLMRALTTGGARVPFKGMKTFKEIVAAGLFIETEFVAFEGGSEVARPVPVAPLLALRKSAAFTDHVKAVQKAGFELFVKRARVGASKHTRVRPRFDAWSASGVLEVTDERISPESLREIFAQAGRAGLGDWRPSSPKSPGPYGMFDSELKPAA